MSCLPQRGRTNSIDAPTGQHQMLPLLVVGKCANKWVIPDKSSLHTFKMTEHSLWTLNTVNVRCTPPVSDGVAGWPPQRGHTDCMYTHSGLPGLMPGSTCRKGSWGHTYMRTAPNHCPTACPGTAARHRTCSTHWRNAAGTHALLHGTACHVAIERISNVTWAASPGFST